jgi:hypothetical protein
VEGRSGEELLALPIRLRGIALGRTVDLIVDESGRALVGFDVHCGDDMNRFLAFKAAYVRADEVRVGSPLTLLDSAELAFYRKRGSSLASLRGAPVSRAGEAAGTLRDIVVAEDGSIAALVVEGAAGDELVPFDDTVQLGPERRRAPAA